MIPKYNSILLKGMKIYTEDQTIEKGYIKVENQKIMEMGSIANLTNEDGLKVIEVPEYFHAVPGFIDVHIHGVNGADTMDATTEAIDTMATSLPREGTTSFLATTMTQEAAKIEAAIVNASNYIASQPTNGVAEVVGIHLEGPFVNPKMAGAQPVQHITEPDLTLFKKWETLSNDTIRLVTIAPEQPGGLELIRYLKEKGIIASIGHTNATYEDVGRAIEAGANHVTHLFNQMRGLHHREPGVVGAAFLRKELVAELIVDGIHVHPEMVKLAYLQKQSEGLILITDSMRAKCMKNGQYDLGGQEVTVKDGKATLADGTLAGSILTLGHGVRNMMTYSGCSLHEVIKMASVNPAKQLKMYDRKGSLTVGKDADIVILDKQMEVAMTICRGEIAFE
ncbi:N-acetylglucosamine-6-phosphate deacetylase [Neobacillus sp. LXY-1]|uniref:N-acetylglucosamine-6-phosphate deacetylase n=1 Tax=Neobacillus sp. LXY-1 TaxID=3379133 RepID=UPI003EE04FF1